MQSINYKYRGNKDMKVNELKEITKKYNETEKEKIIVELYIIGKNGRI